MPCSCHYTPWPVLSSIYNGTFHSKNTAIKSAQKNILIKFIQLRGGFLKQLFYSCAFRGRKSVGCVSVRACKHAQLHWEGGCFTDAFWYLLLVSPCSFLDVWRYEINTFWGPGPRHARLRGLHIWVLQHIMWRELTVTLWAGFYQQNFTSQLSKITYHLTWAETDGAGLIPS